MINAFKLSILFLLVLIIGLHLWSTEIFVQSWHDLSILHDTARTFLNGEGLYPKIHPEFNDGREMLLYGPIYFVLQGGLIALFGKSHLIGVTLSLISGFAFAFAVYRYAKVYWTPLAYLIFLVLLFSDAVFVSGMHNGRMDILASLFTFIAFLKAIDFKGKTNQVFWISLWATSAVLTTPRIAVILLPSLLFIAFQLIFKYKNLKQILLFIGLPLALVSLWIQFGFGGYSKVYDYFFVDQTLHLNEEGNLVSKFIGAGFTMLKTQYVLYFALVISSILVCFKDKSTLKKPWFFISWLSIIAFYLLIIDFGNYSLLVIYISYFLLIKLALKLITQNIWTSRLLNGLVLGHNTLIFLVMMSFTISAYPYNSTKTCNAFLDSYVTHPTRICGLPLHYFSAIESGHQFRLWSHLEVDHEKNKKLIFNSFKPEYLLLKQTEFSDIDQSLYNISLTKVAVLDLSGKTYQEFRKTLQSNHLGGSFLTPTLDFSGTTLYKVTYN